VWWRTCSGTAGRVPTWEIRCFQTRFEEIQRRHYQKKTDPSARSRAEKTLEDCLDAIATFRQSLARRLATKLETAQATEAIRGSDAG
jgi:hypothetical protein